MAEITHNDCPYGADSCPKIEKLEEMLLENRAELKVVNENVIAISTTLKNTAYLIGIIVAIICAIIGLVVL